jgi:arylsulfatase A-like enzyme
LKRKPNILFFFTDDQRFNTIAALGNNEIHTPNMDELVRSGTAFTHAHIPGGTSGAVCMPSRAMLHTGRTLFHLHNNGNRIPRDHIMLGEALQQAGYKTFGVGKWHNGPDSYARSFMDGGEIMFGGMADHWNVPAYSYDPTGKYDKVTNQVRNPFADNKLTKNICDHITPGKHSSELFSDFAVDWLGRNTDDEPFFVYIAYMAPHDPRTMPQQFLDMYDPQKLTFPANFMEEHPFDFGGKNGRDEVLAAYPRTEEETRRHLAEYYGMISHLDHQLGKVVDALKKSGKYEDTIIVFAGDNGLALGQHGLMGKQNNYEHSIRIPLIMAGPGIGKNAQTDAYVYLLDIYPTLCELIGIDRPASVDGQSFAATLRDPAAPARETLYFAFTEKIRSVKDRRYKLIEYRHKGNKLTQLFDLDTDPNELTNLHGKQEYSEIEERLRGELHHYKQAWDDEAHPMGKTFWNAF